MKYVAYILFTAFIVTALLFLKSALSTENEPPAFIGSNKCAECHRLKVRGDQFNVWEESKHSKSFESLKSELAKEVTTKNNLEEPTKNKLCLKCHTTNGHAENISLKESFNINEGVGCEGCHGAGSNFSKTKIMEDEQKFKEKGGVVGDENTCLKCHSQKGNPEKKILDNVCPFQKSDFDYKTSFEKIKHPVIKENF